MKKAIVFDFDGTLTKKDQNIWKMLWNKCGYETGPKSLYVNLYIKHRINREISRQEWFDTTCMAFRVTRMNHKDLIDVSEQIELLPGTEKLIKTLHKKGYKLFIVSGCIKETIELVLGDLAKYFTHIESNTCEFDKDGHLTKLIPTKYDYEGKADFVEHSSILAGMNYLKQNGYNQKNIIFVGNGDNDEWVYKTGCTTICINPTLADYTNNIKWNKVYKDINDITGLMQATNEAFEK